MKIICPALLLAVIWFFSVSVAVGEPSATYTQPPANHLIDDKQFLAAIEELERSPRVRTEIIGTTHEGRPIILIIIANAAVQAELEAYRRRAVKGFTSFISQKTIGSTRIESRLGTVGDSLEYLPVMVAGASWGNEASQVEGILEAAKTLAFDDTEEVKRALSGTIALLVPLMNPDGRQEAIAEWTKTPLSNGDSGIGNAFGFLLNRDFMHGIQPESRAIIRTVMHWRPAVLVDQHEDAYNLGVRIDPVCFVEPFERGFDVEEHPLTRKAVTKLGGAIAHRWEQLGFDCIYDEKGDKTFAPVPEFGAGINPVASSAGRLNLLGTTHGIPSFITESSRTPTSQSWGDRVKQKSSSVLAVLLEVSSDTAFYTRTILERRTEEARRGLGEFVVIEAKNQSSGELGELFRIMDLHRISVYRVNSPRQAFVIPLAQVESNAVRHLILAERSKLNELPPALGVDITKSEEISKAERKMFAQAELHPVNLLEVASIEVGNNSLFAAKSSIASTVLANRLVSSGTATVFQSGDIFVLKGGTKFVELQAELLGVELSVLEEMPIDARQYSNPPRTAVYGGQGIPAREWGDVAWALRQGEFPYKVVDENKFTVDDVDVLIVPNGAAPEIVNGWNSKAVTRASPWEPAENPKGLGEAGLDKIRRFVERGGTYIGLGGGGAQLAGSNYLGLTDVDFIESDLGLGQVLLNIVDPDSPLFFGYPGDEPISAFFSAPPGSSKRGHIFGRNGALKATYAGVNDYKPEMSFRATQPLEPGGKNSAIVHEKFGLGDVIIFGIAPTFRGQWQNTYRLLYNAMSIE